MGIVLAMSLADLAAPQGALAAAGSAPATGNPVPGAPQVPGAPTTGQVESTLPSAPTAPELKSAPLTSTPPPTTAEVASGGPTITVTGFDISGNTIYDSATLQALIADYVGKDLTLAGIYNAAAVITRYYQDHGYGIARATVPQQTLEGGRVQLLVLEGRIGAIHVEGNAHTRTSAILRQGSAVKSGDVYTDAAMERAALLVNDLPGLSSQAVLSPGSDFGTSDITYKITEEPAYSGQVTVDDYGRPDIGRVRISSEVNVASLTGNGDRLTADVLHAEHDLLDYGSLTYNLPVNDAGGRLNVAFGESRYHVTGIFSALRLAGSGKNAGLTYMFPELRSRDGNFFASIGLLHESGVTTITVPATVTDPVTHKPVQQLETFPISSSNLNYLQVSGLYSRSFEDNSYYYAGVALSTNGRHDDGNDPSAERAKLQVDSGYQLPFADTWTFLTKGSAVWSPDPLSDTEKFSLGGPDNLRGYPSADVRGDSGFYGSLELQHSLAPGLPLTLGGFFDVGRVWSRHFDTPFTVTDLATGQTFSGVFTTPPEVHTLGSVGAELIYESSDKRWESRLEWAYAVGYAKPSDGNTGGHVWATFGMNF